MTIPFRPGGLPAWIGSLPVKDHDEALRLMFEYTPDVPIWVQLPYYRAEGMVAQFAPGMPGLKITDERIFVDDAAEDFDEQQLRFFEEYMAVTEGGQAIDDSRFTLSESEAPGFYKFMQALNENLDGSDPSPAAVKGQVTGPFTFGTGLVDAEGRAVFYNEQLRDAAVKLIAQKARWQVSQLKKYGVPVIIFLDEPALAGYGSSAFISVSREEIEACFAEVIDAIHQEGGLAGVHVCANAEWSIILESAADVVSFDAYSYFDKFMLYPDQIKQFMGKGGILAWGIVPTGPAEVIETETADSIFSLWQQEAARLEGLGYDKDQIVAQSLITPSCGKGSLSVDQAVKVIGMNKAVSEKVRGY